MALERLPEVGIGIRVKLVVLMGAVTVGIVAVLATYFPARQIGELREGVRDRAEVYAALASLQLRSAVAFSDRETSREVLSAIAKDQLIDSVAVYSQRGELLHAEGVPSDLAQRCRLGLSERIATFHLPGRVLAAAPIKSLEGVRGTLVLELSTRSASEMRNRLVVTALWVGGAALLLGMLAAWLIARSLSRRVEGLTGAVAVMAQGDFEHGAALNGPNDEIGVLSHAFNAMGRKLNELVGHIQRTAREQNARLELQVRERTDELDRKNRDLRLVLDNVEQGFVTIDRQALVVGEYSLAIASWLGSLDNEGNLWRQLAGDDAELQQGFELAWQQVLDGVLPPELSLAQMPARLELAGRQLSLEYKPLGSSEDFERLLIVLSDITAVVAREHSERETRDLMSVSERLLHDRSGFLEFLAECERLFQSVSRADTDATTLKRDLHTLKGNLALYGMSGIARRCHELESAVQEQPLAAVDRSKLVQEWQHLSAMIKRLLGESGSARLEVSEADYTRTLQAIRRHASHVELEKLLGAWQLESLQTRLERVAEQLSALAAKAGKGSVAVTIAVPELYLARDELRDFWSGFSHLVRNAVAYGLRPGRSGRGDAARAGADFELRAGIETGRLFVEIADFGPGIDWQAIARQAKARGLPHGSAAELEQALFADGISTRGSVPVAASGWEPFALLAWARAAGSKSALDRARGRAFVFRGQPRSCPVCSS